MPQIEGNMSATALPPLLTDVAEDIEDVPTSDEEVVEVTESDGSLVDQKVSGHVRIQRWPVSGPLVGPAIMMVSLESAADGLYNSGFMKDWVVSKIKEHLQSGGQFVNRGKFTKDYEAAIVPNGKELFVQTKSEYRMALDNEVLDYADHQEYANITGHRISKRAQEKGYILRYHEDLQSIKLYDSLPRQAKILLDILNETGRVNFTEASIEIIFNGGSSDEISKMMERLKSKQPPFKILAFYKRRLIDEGHLEEVS